VRRWFALLETFRQNCAVRRHEWRMRRLPWLTVTDQKKQAWR
jgi:hypothetical protein